jgi:hypothetical protein
MAKKHDGKFMKNGPGYSFPYEKKLAVDTEWKRFLKEGVICVVEKVAASTATVDIGVGTDSLLTSETSEVGVQTCSIPVSAKKKIKKKKNAEMQTQHTLRENVTFKYKFDLPLSFKKHYKEYSDLVLSIT